MDSDDEIVHIKRSELERLKERDRNYSDDLYAHMSTSPWISMLRTEYERIVDKVTMYDKVIEHIGKNTKIKTGLDELLDKAKKWDAFSLNLYDEYKEKAKKWDSHQEIWKTDLHINKERLNELEDKAKKWDEIANIDGGKYVDYIEELEEKAKKWDECECQTGSKLWGLYNLVDVQKWRDKAKKWDRIREFFDTES